LGLLLLMGAISFGAAYLVLEWRMGSEQAALAAMRQETLDDVAALRQEFQTTTTDLEAQVQRQRADLQADMQRVEEAAQAAGVLLEQDGELTNLQARLAEIETLKLDLRTTRAEMEDKLTALEESMKEQVASSGAETAAALSLEMTVKNLLVKAQGEVLLTQVYWAEGNRGLARDELALAYGTLEDALAATPASAQPEVRKVLDLAESTKAALILDSASARDQLNLLWHEVSDLLAVPVTGEAN